MEEIEYLEEYEDFIMPSGTNRLAAERRSVDSLEVLYRDLIGEVSCPPTTITTNISPYTVKPIANTDNRVHQNPVDVGFPISKSSTSSASYGHTSISTTSDLQQPLYKSQSSSMPYINRPPNKSFSTYSSLQRTDKLKSVATVKPTLQRVINSPKQSIRNNSPPLKNTTIEQPLHSSSLVTSTGITETKNQFKVPKSKVIKITNQYPGSGVDPLSLDENDTFLDFDVEKNGSVDDFDFESDLDIPLSDMESDSVDLSDDYSDGNFDLESDLSSDSSEIKRGTALKRKKLQESYNNEKLKAKPEPKLSKPAEQKRVTLDEPNLMQNQRPQPYRVGADHTISHTMCSGEKKPIHAMFVDKKAIASDNKSQVIEKKESLVTPLTSKGKQLSLIDQMPKLQPQVLNSPPELEKALNVIASSKKQMIGPPCKKEIIARKPNECTSNLNSKPSPAIVNQEKSSSDKHDNTKTPVNVGKLKPNADMVNTKSKEPLINEVAKKFLSDVHATKTTESQQNIENSNQKDASLEKNVRLKFSSLYLKSIKPPTCQRLLPPKKLTNVQQQLEQKKNPITYPPAIKKRLESQLVKGKNIPIKTTIEKKISTPSRENKTCSNETKSDHSIEPKKVQRKSLAKRDDDRSYRKSKGIDESESSDKSKKLVRTQTNHHPEGFGSQLNCSIVEKLGTPIQSEIKINKPVVSSTNCLLEKRSENVTVVSSTICSVEKRLENVTIASNPLKENEPKPQFTYFSQNVKNKSITRDGKVSKLCCKFKPRRFQIRLNKNKVVQFLRSSTDSLKQEKAPSTNLNVVKHEKENSLKRKMLDAPVVDVNPAILDSSMEANQDKISKSQKDLPSETHVLSKKAKLSFDISPKVPEKRTKKKVKDTTSTKKETRRTVRKWKKRKLKPDGSPKVLRSYIKSLPPNPEIINQHVLNSDAVPKEANVMEKETKIKKPPKVVTNVSCSSPTAEVVKVKNRVGRPVSKKTLRRLALAKRLREILEETPTSTKENSSDNNDKDQTPISIAPVVEEHTENIVPETLQSTDSVTSHGDDNIEPKTEPFGETVIFQFHPVSTLKTTCADSTNNIGKQTKLDKTYSSLLTSTESCKRNNQSLLDASANMPISLSTSQDSVNRNDTGIIAFELPSFIVMKTKIITRQDLHSSKAQIPSLVKQKINKLSEERQVVAPVLKTERPDFKEVCLEINALLGQNANYLKFASGTERQTRMNQVLSDSSLTVEDAQCALKFLQSYLSLRSKEVTIKPKGQQFIPIYDSQKKIIGYRKRIIHSKRPASIRVSNLSAQSTREVSALEVHTVTGTMTANKGIEFTTKQEPQSTDAGDEEIIVPDAAPADQHCIKSEEDSSKGITGEA